MENKEIIEEIKSKLKKNDKGNVTQGIANSVFVLKHDPLLKDSVRRNILMGMIDIVKPMPWSRRSVAVTDTDINNIRFYMEINYDIRNHRSIRAAIDIVANENSYHPIVDILESLQWDGVQRISRALHHFLGAELNEYNSEVLKMHMMAAIHRVYEPGCKYDICMVFVGDQGGGKSSFLRMLAMKDDWFTDDIKKLNDDKVYQYLQGHWIIELSEMSAVTKAQIEDTKAFLSRQKDNYRIPYETRAEDRPRQCIVCGTSNNPRFLPLDRTGNRRFAPVIVDSGSAEVHPLTDQKATREYLMQTWAEAMVLYKKAVAENNLYLTFSKDMEEYARQMQKDCMKEDVVYGMVEAFLENHEDDKVCCPMIAHDVFGVEDPKKQGYDADKYTEIMRIAGWKCINTRVFADYGGQKAWIKTGGILDKDAWLQKEKGEEVPF